MTQTSHGEVGSRAAPVESEPVDGVAGRRVVVERLGADVDDASLEVRTRWVGEHGLGQRQDRQARAVAVGSLTAVAAVCT